MNIDKDQILGLLRSQGDHAKADQAQNELPNQVDTDNNDHQNVLQKLGINAMDLLGKLGAGESGGGLGGALGKLL